MTFSDLQIEATRFYRTRYSKLAREIDYLVDAARVNADDTVYVEKSSDDYEAVALASLATVLCGSDVSKKARDWFTRRGIKF